MDIFKQIKIMIKDNVTITIHDICREYDKHIDDAKIILNEFIDNNKDEFYHINYYVHWIEQATENSQTVQRFLIINNKDDLNYYRDKHENIDYHIYSISKSNKLINNEFVFNKYIYNINEIDIETIQKPSYIKNDLIKYRPNRRNVIIENNVNNNTNNNNNDSEIKSNGLLNKKRQQQQEKQQNDNKIENGMNKYKRIKTLDADYDDENELLNKVDEEIFDDLFKDEKISSSLPSKQQPKQEQITKKQNIVKNKIQTQSTITSFFKKK